MMNCELILIPIWGGWVNAPIRVATALQSLPIGTSVIPSSGTYVGSMRKRSMNKTRLFLSGLSIRHTSRKDPRLLGFASHLSMTAWQSSLRQFACICFALGDCSLFLAGNHIDGDRSGRRWPWRAWCRCTIGVSHFSVVYPRFYLFFPLKIKYPILFTRVVLKRQFTAFYSLVVWECFRQTETPWSKMTNLRAATCEIFWLFVGVGNLANFFAYK